MMIDTDLSFLIELLLEHKLQPSTKKLIKDRIREVEAQLHMSNLRGVVGPAAPTFAPSTFTVNSVTPTVSNPTGVPQAASTLAAMARHDNTTIVMPPAAPKPEPVAVIAQTPAAIAAMASRNQAINESISGKVDKQTGRPRKF